MVSKHSLMQAAWPDTFVGENNLHVQIAALRRVLGEGVITTVSGRGYRFVADAGDQSETPVPDALIGRDDDLARLVAALQSSGLVTLTGPGGVGKTRLARAAAARCGRPVLWIDLSALSDGALLPRTLATASGATDDDWRERLSGRDAVLVLDNAEHLIDSVREVAANLTGGRLTVLATSQALLRVTGERAHRLAGLAPADAAELFAERARRLAPDFRPADHAATVADICRRLDGQPLALELAAARLNLFPAADLAARLDQRFAALGRGSADAPPRHQALQAVLDWSYGLLDPAEAQVFRRLGALPAAFDVADAVRVAAGEDGEWPLIDVLGDLADRSLVEAGPDGQLRLTETARAYALDRLVEADDVAALERGRDLASTRAASAGVVDAAALRGWALELQRRIDRLRPDPHARLRLLLDLGPALQAAVSPASLRCGEIYAEAAQVAEALQDPRGRFHAVWGQWQHLSMAGRVEEAAPMAAVLTALGRELGDDGLELEAWHAAFTTAQLRGDVAAALTAAEHTLRLYDVARHASLAHAFGGHDARVCALGQSAVALAMAGRRPEARVRLAEAVEAGKASGDSHSEAVGLFYGAMAAQIAGDGPSFAAAAEDLLALAGDVGLAALRVEAELLVGRARFEAGDRDAGLEAMCASLDRIEASGELGFIGFYAALVAEAELARGDAAAALARLDRAVPAAAQGQGFFMPEVQRLRAIALRSLGQVPRADIASAQAIRLADAQGATLLAQRARA